MDVIVRGEPHEIDFVRCICRDKVRRGVLAILPATRPASDDVVVKLRNECDETTKENERLWERVAELEHKLANVASSDANVACNVATSTDNVATSDDNVDSVPNTAENVPGYLETANNDGEKSAESPESVPNPTDSTEVESDPETPDAMDDKYIDNDDLQEVDLDADDKTLIEDDSKDVPAVDAKKTKTTGKTSKRSKKSE